MKIKGTKRKKRSKRTKRKKRIKPPILTTMDIKEQTLKRLHNTYTRIARSPLHGVGVFAIRNININTDPFPDIPDTPIIQMTKGELSGLDPGVTKMIDDFFLTRDYIFPIPITGLNSLDVSFFLNHNDKYPNIIKNSNSNTYMNTFLTSRPIVAGEELTFNYNN
jgi:hypothetical protein